MWLYWIAAVIAVPLAVLALLEAGLRIAEVGRPTSFFVEAAEPGFVQTNQYFGHRFFPGSIARTPEVEHFRRVKERGTYRIFVLGGSAAMGFPEPAFGVARILETLLREEYEDLTVEVINAAMTAVNSHVVLPIARECARYEPDALVIYLGNNEVVGPYGPSSIIGDPGASLPAVKVAVRVRGTRIGQLLHRVAGLGGSNRAPSEWRGMEMFLQNQIPFGDSRLERVYESFRANLTDICQAGLDADARVVLSTVPVNLADCAPFATQSLERDRARLQEWKAAYQAGVMHQKQRQFTEAIHRFEYAAGLHDGSADLAFRLGQCYRELGQGDKARRYFEQARDLDSLRFRADSTLNGVIRDVVSRLGEDGLVFVDVEKLFENESRAGLPGDEWFFEHVHLNFSGNYFLARSIADSLRHDLQGKGARKRGHTASEQTIAERMVLTRWDRYRMWRDIAGLMEGPPFSNQLNHAAVRAETSARLRTLLGEKTLRERKAAAAALYEESVEQTPGDRHLRRRYAELLDSHGLPREAASHWRVLVDAAPDNLYWRASLGASLRESGDLNEASRVFQDLIGFDKGYAAAYFGLGTVLQKQGKLAEAVDAYREALRLRPGYAEAVNNLGLIALERERTTEALAHFQQAIEMRPAFAQAHENLGVTRLELGRTEAAHEAFRRAIEIDPDAASPRYHLGASLAASGRFAEALPVLAEAVRLNPASADSQHSLAGVLAAEGRIEEALGRLDEAIRLRPRFADALYNRGLILARRGNLETAISSYKRAVEARPNYPEAWNNLGTAYARLGEMEQAEQCFEAALKLRPAFEDACRNLEKVQSARSDR